MEKEFKIRKLMRLDGFDYSKNGAYFITICTKNKEPLFGDLATNKDACNSPIPVGADSISARMIKRTFIETINSYTGVSSPIYVVMPNHFHAIIFISENRDSNGILRADIESAPTTLSEIVQSFKRYSTLEYIKLVKENSATPFDKQLWQRSFYDHIIRNEKDYEETYKYIYENPIRWETKFTK